MKFYWSNYKVYYPRLKKLFRFKFVFCDRSKTIRTQSRKKMNISICWDLIIPFQTSFFLLQNFLKQDFCTNHVGLLTQIFSNHALKTTNHWLTGYCSIFRDIYGIFRALNRQRHENAFIFKGIKRNTSASVARQRNLILHRRAQEKYNFPFLFPMFNKWQDSATSYSLSWLHIYERLNGYISNPLPSKA